MVCPCSGECPLWSTWKIVYCNGIEPVTFDMRLSRKRHEFDFYRWQAILRYVHSYYLESDKNVNKSTWTRTPPFPAHPSSCIKLLIVYVSLLSFKVLCLTACSLWRSKYLFLPGCRSTNWRFVSALLQPR